MPRVTAANWPSRHGAAWSRSKTGTSSGWSVVSRGRSGSDWSTARGIFQVRPPGPASRRSRRTMSESGGRTTVTIEASTAGSSKAAPQSITTAGPPAAKINSRRAAKSRLRADPRRHDEAAGRLRFGDGQTPFQKDGRQVPVPPGGGVTRGDIVGRGTVDRSRAHAAIGRIADYDVEPAAKLLQRAADQGIAAAQVLIQAGKESREARREGTVPFSRPSRRFRDKGPSHRENWDSPL